MMHFSLMGVKEQPRLCSFGGSSQAQGNVHRGLASRVSQHPSQNLITADVEPCDRPPPPPGSPGPFGPGTPEESEKSTPGQGPKSAQRVRPGVSKEYSFRTLLRLRGAFFGHFWGPAPGYSFRTLFGLFRGSGPEGPGRPCVGGGAGPIARFETPTPHPQSLLDLVVSF